MKNSEEHIDKLFRDKLGNQSFDIPDGFIDSLNGQLDEIQPSQNRKNIILFYFLNSLFLIFFLAISFNSQDIEATTLTMLKYDSQNENLNELIGKSEKSASNRAITSKDDQLIVENSDILRSKTKVELKLEELIDDKLTKSNNEVQTSFQENRLDKITTSKKLNETLIERDKTQNNTFKSVDYNILKSEKNNSLDNISTDVNNQKNEDKTNEIFISKRDENQEGLELASKNISKSKNENINKAPNFTDSTKISEADESTIISDSTQATRKDSISLDVEKTIENSSSNSEQNKIKFEAQVFAGFNYGGQYFYKNKQTGSNFNLEESPSFTPTFGFNINATLKNFSLGSGIDYFKTREKLDLNTTHFFQEETIEIVDYMTDSIFFDSLTQVWDTTYIPVYDTVIVFDTVTKAENWINTYTWISVPLNVGYRFDYGKWAIIPKVGMTLNFGLRNSNGQYYNENNSQLISAAPVKFNLDYLLQLELRRPINKFEIYLSPTYRGNLTPMLPDSPIRKHKSLGVRFGVAYQF